MKKHIYLLLLPLMLACGKETKQENNSSSDSVATTAKDSIAVAENTEPNYLDTLVGTWLEVGKANGTYIHSISEERGEAMIIVEKKDSGYYLTARDLDIDMPGPDVYKMDSIRRVFAGSIANTYEYVVNIKAVNNDKTYELYFTPLHQSMQNAIRISGFFPDEYHQYFMNETQKDKYKVIKE